MRPSTCLLKYSSTPSMKMATGELDRAQARHQVAVRVCAAALELARREIEEADEVVDDALELLVGDQASESGANLEPVQRADVLERRKRDRREPDLRPRKGRHHEEGQELPAEDLVADRFVEEDSRRQAGRPSLTLVKDALGLEKQGLAEALGADDDELVVPVRTQEAVDLGRAMEEGLVEILCNPDVIRVNSPCAHTFSRGALKA